MIALWWRRASLCALLRIQRVRHNERRQFGMRNKVTNGPLRDCSACGTNLVSVLDSIVVSIPACHAGDRGLIPCRGDNIFISLYVLSFEFPRVFCFSACTRPSHTFFFLNINPKLFVRSGIRTHAHRSGLRPERSALDRSAILTRYWNVGMGTKLLSKASYVSLCVMWI